MAQDDITEVSVIEMESLISKLPTVLKSAVTVNDWGGVEEVHVLTTLERTPKQIVRDVESALLAQWNLRVDHKRISVAQIMSEEEARGERPRSSHPGRLTIREYRMDADSIQQRATTRVVFGWSSDAAATFEGEWTGRYAPSQYYHVMAWAAVDAINKISGLQSPFVLMELKNMVMVNRVVIMVALSQFDHRRRETLVIGAAEEHGDGQGASVRAVLDAVNRKLSGLDQS